MKYQQSQDGRVGLRRQFQVLVRKGMGSNPILDKTLFFLFRIYLPFHFGVREKYVIDNLSLTLFVSQLLGSPSNENEIPSLMTFFLYPVIEVQPNIKLMRWV